MSIHLLATAIVVTTSEAQAPDHGGGVHTRNPLRQLFIMFGGFIVGVALIAFG